jgi:TetR/AcrR family fatty acid metabolism transcriptional regulator
MRRIDRQKHKELAEKRHNQILDAASEEFSKYGFAKTTIDQVAARAALGKGTIYQYFKNKKTLFLCLGKRGMDRLKDSVTEVIDKETDPIKKIEAAITAYLSFFENNTELARIFMQEQSEFRRKIQKRYFEHYYGRINRMREIFKSAVKEGFIKDIDVDEIISLLTSMLNGLTYMWQVEGMRYSLVDKIPIILEVFFKGVINSGEKRSEYEFSKRR